MDDWRLIGQEEYLKGVTLLKIKFPEFWETAYKEKNAFYLKIEKDAKEYVNRFKSGEEYLEGEKIQAFWHEHCEFCTDKILTTDNRECYCTENLYHWICKECFEDFKKDFVWKVK